MATAGERLLLRVGCVLVITRGCRCKLVAEDNGANRPFCLSRGLDTAPHLTSLLSGQKWLKMA